MDTTTSPSTPTTVLEPITSLPTVQSASDCVGLAPLKRDDGSIDWEATTQKLKDAYSGFPHDVETGAPAWKAAYSTLWAQEQEREITARMADIDGRAGEIPGLQPADWTHRVRGDNAIVVDPEVARTTKCTRVNVGDGGYVVYSKGIVGALDDAQITEYCSMGFDDRVATPAQSQRFLTFAEAANSCSLESRGTGAVDVFFTCLGKELKKRGVEA